MKISKKLIGASHSTHAETPHIDEPLITVFSEQLIKLLKKSPTPFSHIPFKNAMDFIASAKTLCPLLIKHHSNLYDWLVCQSSRLFETYQKSSALLALSQYKANYEKTVKHYQESRSYDALSALYFTILSLQTLGRCNYWHTASDAPEFNTQKTAFNDACAELLAKIYPALSTHHSSLDILSQQKTDHPSELPVPDSVLFDPASEIGTASWPSLFHPNEDQDALFVSKGTTLVLDGVSEPSSHDAPRSVGRHILEEINAKLPLFLETASGNPATPEWQLQIIDLIYQIVRTSVYTITDHRQATTLALTITLRVTAEKDSAAPESSAPAQYYIFSMHAGDSEAVIADTAAKKITPLNPFLLQADLTSDHFPITLPSGIPAAIYSTEAIQSKLTEPHKRVLSDPGFLIQTDASVPCVITITKFSEDEIASKRTFLWSDGFKDSFVQHDSPIQTYPDIAEIIDQFTTVGASNSQIAHGLVALTKLHFARAYSHPRVFGKEDDVSVIVSTPATQHWDYAFPKKSPSESLLSPHASPSPPKSPDGGKPKRSPRSGHHRSTEAISQ